jgi:hypothetical protein
VNMNVVSSPFRHGRDRGPAGLTFVGFVIPMVLILLVTCPLQAQTIEELTNAEENYKKCATELDKARTLYKYG